MSKPPDWLPEALRWEDFGGDWNRFLAAIYRIFERDFKRSKPNYGGHPVTYDAEMENGKEAVFWHVTTSVDDATHERVPDLRRCERISWLRPIIEHSNDKVLKVWREKRRTGARIHFWLEEFDYLVVLAERPRAVILVTAIHIDSKHTRRNLRKRWGKFSRKQTPPRGAT
jgi:hypothetical protein